MMRQRLTVSETVFVSCVLCAFALTFAASVGAKAADDTPLTFMSYNIRLLTPVDKENCWDNRKEALVAEIVANDPDVFGVQEATWPQMQYLAKTLPDYAWIGVGRDDGKKGGEFSAVFYRKSAFDLLDSGTFWLSETPEVAGSLGWDAACRRVVSWGKFKMKSAPGRLFVYANTHFDHKGSKARTESAALIQRRLAQIAGDLPLVVSGDFNSTKDSNVYKILTGGVDGKPGLVDTNPAAAKRTLAAKRTFHNYGHIPKDTDYIIDYLFVNDGKWIVDSFTICPDSRNGRFTSDHQPIVAKCRVK